MKVDTHTHTSGVSFCSEVSPQAYVDAYALAGFKTVVLTNHFSRIYMTQYGNTIKQQVSVFLDEYTETARLGKQVGLNVLLGAEVAISTPKSPYVEFLLYGADEAFFLDAPPLYDLTQKQLYKLCHDHGVVMFQSHPYRDEQGHFPQAPEFLDGVEINCHPYFLRREDQVRAFADKHGLGLVCGSDFHYLSQVGIAATLVSNSIRTNKEFADFLKANKRPEIFIR